MTRRTERIGNLIRNVVAEAIQRRLSDPRIVPLTSVTRVEVAADLSVAHVHVSVMESEAKQKLCVLALQNAARRMRAMLAERLVARQVPRLDFKLDQSVKESFRTVETIDAAMAELGEHLPWEVDDESSDEETLPEQSDPTPEEKDN